MTDHPGVVEHDSQTIVGVIDEAVAIIGRDWFQRRLKRDARLRDEASRSTHDRRLIRYAPSHRLIEWYVEYEQSRQDPEDAPPRRNVVLLGQFATNFVRVKELAGLPHVTRRLRLDREFPAALFEIEVAVAHLNTGHRVEFVAPTEVKFPDLLATTVAGVKLWIECKVREIPQRDLEVQSFWRQLRETLYRRWGPEKTNVALSVTAKTDPLAAERTPLAEHIFERTRRLLSSKDRFRSVVWTLGYAGKYDIEVTYLADPDVESLSLRGKDRGFDEFDVLSEVHVTDGAPRFRNHKVFEFTSRLDADRLEGVVNLFRAAAKQLPPDGPGAIWIKIPFPTGHVRVEEKVQKLIETLTRELSGENNRRVNAVVLVAQTFQQSTEDGRQSLTTETVLRSISHRSPRSPHEGIG